MSNLTGRFAFLVHTDESMQNLAGKIGYTIDWTQVDR